ncbi:PDDEXK nuclease domain-containing protein [soil metagenome]
MSSQKDKPNDAAVYDRVQVILESAQMQAARSVNTAQIVANGMIGREIVEEQQKGAKRAGYAERMIPAIATRLAKMGVRGYGELTLRLCRQFYLNYPELPGSEICYALRNKSPRATKKAPTGYAVGSQSAEVLLLVPQMIEASRREEWQPGLLHPGLSWTHYRALMRVSNKGARAFYEIEAIQQNWKARELERQINSLLFERLAKSRDKKGVMKLATKGHEIQKPADVFKDPVVMEFLDLPESHRLMETKLEEVLITNLQQFLLELGKGFAFVSRQERLTLEGDHFYVDLVFYHTVLKCHVLIDLKVSKLTHQDIGQMQLYVNYYDRERRTPGDNPTLGLILCTDKNETAVKYTLGTNQKKIFTSRYQFHLPTESDLAAEIHRELAELEPLALKKAKAKNKIPR